MHYGAAGRQHVAQQHTDPDNYVALLIKWLNVLVVAPD